MERKIFAICDPDQEFVFRFMEFAKRRCPVSMDVKAFTSEEHLCLMAETRVPDLLLVSSTVLTMEIRNISAENLVVLAEEQGEEIEGLPCVYKYQAPEELLRKTFELCEREEPQIKGKLNKEGMEIIGIYSPVGRTRSTTFALTMGQILAENKSVLYLNLETFAGFEQMFSEQYERTLSDLLYFGRQEQTDLQLKLRGIVRRIQKMDYVPPVFCPEDLQGTSLSEWLELFRKLKEQTGYQILLLDIGEAIQGLTDVLAACNRIYMPIRTDPLSQAKLAQFSWVLEKMQGAEVEKRIRQIKLPLCQSNKTGKAFFTELVHSELGDFVRKELAEEADI